LISKYFVCDDAFLLSKTKLRQCLTYLNNNKEKLLTLKTVQTRPVYLTGAISFVIEIIDYVFPASSP